MNDNTVNAIDPIDPLLADSADIPSVNKKGSSDNKVGKAIFLVVVAAVLVGGITYIAQVYATRAKQSMKPSGTGKQSVDTAPIFNPEKTGTAVSTPKLGADGVAPGSAPTPGVVAAPAGNEIRPIRGADGKPMVNGQGRAMGVDRDGNVVEVPAIALAGAAKPLPGQSSSSGAAAAAGGGGVGGGQPPPKPPSRFGGSLFVGDAARPSGENAVSGVGAAPGSMAAQAAQVEQIMKQLGMAAPGAPAPGRASVSPPTVSDSATPYFGQPPGAVLNPVAEPVRAGTVGSALFGSSTPVARAKRFPDQNLMLPKGRQADCVLTGRIADDVPGFTSCTLTQNMYGDNGRVLLLERGSELIGEYGITNVIGSERLFVTWLRVKTPEGVEIDISSPGADRLGTSGLLGHLDNRWGARIGAALLISFVKDISVAALNSQAKSNPGGSVVNVGSQTPGQNTQNAISTIAEEVIKQTIKVRPRLTINEGDRISIYVARDLDFSPVYALKTSGSNAVVKLVTQ